MDLEIDKLRCDKETLRKLATAVGMFKQDAIEMEARAHMLNLRAQGRYVSYYGVPEEEVRIAIPYSGMEYRCYTTSEKLGRSLKAKGTPVEIDTRAKPLGWRDEVASFKRFEGLQLDTREMRNLLGFVLRLELGDVGARFQGVVFNSNELLATDGKSIHGSILSTPITDEPVLCGSGVLQVLHYLLGLDFQWLLYGNYNHTSHLPGYKRLNYGSIQFKLREESGIEVELTSCPQGPTSDMKKGSHGDWIRTPIDEKAICYTVATSFIQEICLFAQKNYSESTLVLTSGEEELAYEIQEGGIVRNEGSIPLYWGGTKRYTSRIALDPVRILTVLKKTKDDYAQFIIPHHPEDGFDYYEINPVYINTNPMQFALIAPMTLDSEKERIQELMSEQSSRRLEREAA